MKCSPHMSSMNRSTSIFGSEPMMMRHLNFEHISSTSFRFDSPKASSTRSSMASAFRSGSMRAYACGVSTHTHNASLSIALFTTFLPFRCGFLSAKYHYFLISQTSSHQRAASRVRLSNTKTADKRVDWNGWIARAHIDWLRIICRASC